MRSALTTLLRHPGRALRLVLYLLTRGSASVIGIRVRRAVLPGLVADCGPGLTLGPDSVIWGFENIRIGRRVSFMAGLRLYATGETSVEIGDEASINDNVQISAGPRGRIALGNGVLVGPNVVLRNCNHAWKDPSQRIRDQGHDCADIIIEDDVWIAANVVVLGGAHIKRGCVIAAGSVVRPGKYGPMSVYAGDPAVQVATRD
jgi:virginiamycin A acetyltransferase